MIERRLKSGSLIQIRLLKERFGERAVYYGGGTRLDRDDAPGGASVALELSALGLDELECDERQLRLGAMLRLDQLLSHEQIPAALKQALSAVSDRSLRPQATLGGEIAGTGKDSPLLPALNSLNARLELYDRVELADREQIPAGEYIRQQRSTLITAVLIDHS